MLVLTGGPRDVADLWFHPDGGGLAARNWDEVARSWRLDAPHAPTPVPADEAGEPADGLMEVVSVAGRRNGFRYAYRLPSGTVAATDPEAFPQATALLADGTRFVAAESASGGAGTGRVRAWLSVRSLADGTELLRLPFRYASGVVLAAVPFSPRVVGTAGGRLVVWDCDAGTCEEVPGRGRKLWRDLAAHPAGRRVLAVNNLPAVGLLDPHSAVLTDGFDPHIGPLTAVAVSPDGLLAAAAGAKGRVAVWDADG